MADDPAATPSAERLEDPSEAIYLGLDTATPYLCLALWSSAAGVLGRFAAEVGREHSARLLLELANPLERAGVRPEALRGIIVGAGPGSYTGLRVGLAAAQGLARGWGVPLAGSSTLAAIAAGALAQDPLKPGERALAVLDARRGNVYATLVERRATGLVVLEEPHKAEREALRARWPEARWLEGLPPDAAYLAAQAPLGAPATPLYL